MQTPCNVEESWRTKTHLSHNTTYPVGRHWETRTGAEKANQEMTEIIPPAGNDLSQGGKGGLRKEEWNIRELRKGGSRSKRSYWT